MLPGDRLKAKMAEFQKQRETPNLATSQGRILANVQSAQANYQKFQQQAANAKPEDVNKYRTEMHQSNLAMTNASRGLSDAEKNAAINSGFNSNNNQK